MFAGIAKAIFGSSNDRYVKSMQSIVARIGAFEPAMQALSDEELAGQTIKFRERLAAGETLDQLMPEAFATVREAAKRVLGQRHYDVQMIGGIVLHRGEIAEMRTGEGKTLVATLAVYLNALAGQGVHVVTVNDYLARRDAEWMGQVYRFLGLTVGVIVPNLTDEQRRDAYGSDITYGTNNEFGFDYLRDNMKYERSQMVQRPYFFAVVDEVDSVLVDEARTPLIISAPAKSDVYAATAGEAVALARQLQQGEHFRLIESQRRVVLTLPGQQLITHLAAELSQSWRNPIIRDELASQAIAALHLYTAGEHYLVKDGEIQIVSDPQHHHNTPVASTAPQPMATSTGCASSSMKTPVPCPDPTAMATTPSSGLRPSSSTSSRTPPASVHSSFPCRAWPAGSC